MKYRLNVLHKALQSVKILVFDLGSTCIDEVPRNRDESLHPFASEREYIRAVNSAKLSRIMAKPFIGALEGTTERMTCISLNSETLALVVFGTADGKCSLDGQLKQWRMDHDDIPSSWSAPLTSVLMKWAPHSLDHHPSSNEFLIGGAESCLLYSAVRMDVPLREWTWGQEPIHCVKFNPVEHNVACALTKDNSLILIDCRRDDPIRKVKMDLKLNSFAWNPMEPFIMTAASEDYNAYTYDTRYFKIPRRMYHGHVNAVLDIDYSPTGREFATASYDSTIQPRERASLRTAEALRDKFQHHPEVRKILKKRHLPKAVVAASREHSIIRAKHRRKDRNIRLHRNQDEPLVSEREKHLVAQYK